MFFDGKAICALSQVVWHGFQQLRCADQFSSVLWQAQTTTTWQEREVTLCGAYEQLTHMHNMLGLTEPLPETISSFFNRPFKIINGGMFAEALVAQITEPTVKRIASRRLIGNIDQFSDSTDLRSVSDWSAILRALYR